MKAPTSSTRTSLISGPCIRGYYGRRLLLFAMRLVAALIMGLGFTLVLLTMNGCAAQRVPDPVVVSVCPPIPVPAKPVTMWTRAEVDEWNASHPEQQLRLFQLLLPAKDAEGKYCLSQEQIHDLAKGIRDLQTYAAQIVAAVTVYTQSIKDQAGTAGR